MVAPFVYAIGLSALVSFSGGAYLGYQYAGGKAAKAAVKIEVAKNEALRENLRVLQEAHDADAKLAAEQAAKMKDMDDAIKDLILKVTHGQCLSSDDVDRLRAFWDRG